MDEQEYLRRRLETDLALTETCARIDAENQALKKFLAKWRPIIEQQGADWSDDCVTELDKFTDLPEVK